MRIGIFGGSFNPPHNMHKKIGLELVEKNYVDKVIYVPTGDFYKKKGLISGEDRYQMLLLMCDDSSCLEVSDYEVRNGSKYTYETLAYFKKLYPDDAISFICGSDNLLDFTNWNNYQYILSLYQVLVIQRGEDDISDMLEHYDTVKTVSIPMSNLSSTKIRELIKLKKWSELETKLDAKVIQYIKQKRLY